MHASDDEITLQELYLIFRSGLPWILAVAAAVAAATFLVMWSRPHRYEATATAQVNPLTITSPNGTANQLDIGVVTAIGFGAYERIALSAPVLQATIRTAPSAAEGLTPTSLARDVSVHDASGGHRPLVVTHTVELKGPSQATALANAWAGVTVDHVRAMLAANVKDVTSKLNDHLDSLRGALDRAQADWQSFEKTDDRSSIRAELSSLDGQTTSLQNRLRAIDRSIARSRAADQMTRSVVQARADGHPADVRTQLRALGDAGAIDPAQADALSNAIASLPNGVSAADQDVATLLARTQLQQDARALAADVAERQTAATQLASFSKTQADLRAELSSLDLRASQLQSDLGQAKQAFDSVYQVSPEAMAVADLVPAMASTVAPASEPLEPIPHHTVTATAVAFVLAFFAMVLAVFLRAAVIEQPDDARGGAAPLDTQGTSFDPHPRSASGAEVREPVRPAPAD